MRIKHVVVWILFIIMVSTVMVTFYPHVSNEISYSTFMNDVGSHRISNIVIYPDNIIEGTYYGGKQFSLLLPRQASGIIDKLHSLGVDVRSASNSDYSISLFAIIFCAALIYIIYRGSKGNGNNSSTSTGLGIGFGKSNIKPSKKSEVKFEDIGGMQEVKEEILEVEDYLSNPEKYKKLGAKMPKGMLLSGEPGTGKTMLAKALSNAAKVPFYYMSGSDFIELFVGVGASRVRELFKKARQNAPCIIYIDEIDSVAKKRERGIGGGHDERDQTLNQLLAEMDGFDTNLGIIVVGATNRPEILDPALLRPGRMDRILYIPKPDRKGREQIIVASSKNIPLGSDIDITKIARMTGGFTGADIANLLNEASIAAAREGSPRVSSRHIDSARDKVRLGLKRSIILTEKDRKIIAYHEAGHAVVALFSPEADPIEKLDLTPRGNALGMVVTMPDSDAVFSSKKQYETRIAILFAGRLSEEKYFGKENVTAGAVSDIEQVDIITEKMVMEYGMGDITGRFKGNDNISEESRSIIDQDIKNIQNRCELRARNIIEKHHNLIENIATAALEEHTLSGEKLLLMKNAHLDSRGWKEDIWEN